VLSADNPFYRRVTLLVELLPLVARASCFALKGGTAINLFVRDLPRLSVDIDLTYLPIKGRDESLAHIDAALRELGSAIEASLPGTKTLSLARAGERMTKFRIQRAREQVQIEVSPVLRGSVRQPEARESTPAVTAQFGLIRIPVLHPLELYAGKFCAALDRQHPRDLFDVMQFQQVGAIDRALFDVFLVYLLSGDRPIAEMLSPRFAPLAQVFRSEFGGMTLVPVTLEDLEEARRTLTVELRAMLTDADKEFLLSVKRGNGNWRSFAYPTAERLPAIQWKLRNIARMTPQKRSAAVGRLEAVLYGNGVRPQAES
jgi:hypothetical protein